MSDLPRTTENGDVRADEAPGPADAPDRARVFRASFSFGAPPAEGADPVGHGPVRRFAWRWEPKADAGEPPPEPATYYEALTGESDPHRDFFIWARRTLNVALWVLALGVPLVLVTLAIVSGETLETVVFIGVGSLFVCLLMRSSVPRLPFGRG